MYVNSLMDIQRKDSTLHLQNNGNILLLPSSLLVPNKNSQHSIHWYWIVAFNKHTSVISCPGNKPKGATGRCLSAEKKPCANHPGFPSSDGVNAERGTGAGEALGTAWDWEMKGLLEWEWRTGETAEVGQQARRSARKRLVPSLERLIQYSSFK